jgi:hypothetical protein
MLTRLRQHRSPGTDGELHHHLAVAGLAVPILCCPICRLPNMAHRSGVLGYLETLYGQICRSFDRGIPKRRN